MVELVILANCILLLLYKSFIGCLYSIVFVTGELELVYNLSTSHHRLYYKPHCRVLHVERLRCGVVIL